jgi:hypothetical protein
MQSCDGDIVRRASARCATANDPASRGPARSLLDLVCPESKRRARGSEPGGSSTMLDLLLSLVTVGFFVLAVLYAHGCERV